MSKGKHKVSRVKKLQTDLEAERVKSDEYLSRLKYLQADFENYRKRVEREIRMYAEAGSEKLVLGLLSVLDELELALRVGRETDNKEALLDGVEMTKKKLFSTLGQQGLARIEAEGKPFDPKLHEVAEKVCSEGGDENVVVEEVRAGYTLGGKVIRPSVVKITSNTVDET